jgi:hypothetical protein
MEDFLTQDLREKEDQAASRGKLEALIKTASPQIA